MNSYDVAIPGSSYNHLDWRRNCPVGTDRPPVSDKNILPSTSRDYRNFDRKPKYWNYYILESESSQSSDEGSETALSIQGKETDRARDTSDLDSDALEVLEYEVATSADEEVVRNPIHFSHSSHASSSDEDVLEATVIHAVLTEAEIMLADSEYSLSAPSTDSELSPFDYWKCVQCHNTNNNPMFRYCEKCYKVRKDFFPPPPKHKRRKNRKRGKKQRKSKDSSDGLGALNQSQGTGLDLQSIKVPGSVKSDADCSIIPSLDSELSSEKVSYPNLDVNTRKRNNDCLDEDDESVSVKKLKTDLFDISLIKNKNVILSENYKAQSLLNIEISNEKDSSFSQPMFSDFNVEPVSKSMSEPAIQFSKDDMDVMNEGNKSVRKFVQSLSRDNQSDMCITCLVEPKSGVFVHGRIAHICCCYKCSLKVWTKTKRCPICNCKVSNVLKAFVM